MNNVVLKKNCHSQCSTAKILPSISEEEEKNYSVSELQLGIGIKIPLGQRSFCDDTYKEFLMNNTQCPHSRICCAHQNMDYNGLLAPQWVPGETNIGRKRTGSCPSQFLFCSWAQLALILTSSVNVLFVLPFFIIIIIIIIFIVVITLMFGWRVCFVPVNYNSNIVNGWLA